MRRLFLMIVFLGFVFSLSAEENKVFSFDGKTLNIDMGTMDIVVANAAIVKVVDKKKNIVFADGPAASFRNIGLRAFYYQPITNVPAPEWKQINQNEGDLLYKLNIQYAKKRSRLHLQDAF